MKQEKTWLSNEAYKKSILKILTVLPFSRGGWQFVAKTSPIYCRLVRSCFGIHMSLLNTPLVSNFTIPQL